MIVADSEKLTQYGPNYLNNSDILFIKHKPPILLFTIRKACISIHDKFKNMRMAMRKNQTNKPALLLYLATLAGYLLINLDTLLQLACLALFLVAIYPDWQQQPDQYTLIVASALFIFICVKLIRRTIKSAKVFGKKVPLRSLPQFAQFINDYCRKVKAKKIDSIYIQHGYHLRLVRRRYPFFPLLKKHSIAIGIETLFLLTTAECNAITASLLNRTARQIPFLQHAAYHLFTQLEFVAKNLVQENRQGIYPRLVIAFFNYFSQLSATSNRDYAEQIILLAAKHTNKDALGMALTKLEMGEYIATDNIWPVIWRQSIQHIYPDFGVYEQFAALSTEPLDKDYRTKILAIILSYEPDSYSLSQSLREQLNLLQTTPEFNDEKQTDTAFNYYFHDLQTTIYNHVNENWAMAALPDWQTHSRELIAASQILERTSQKKALSNDEAVDYAYSLRLVKNDLTLAKFILDEVLTRDPDHAYANYQMAVILSKEYDDNCLNYYLRVMTLDKKHLALSLEQMIKYCYRCNRMQDVSRYQTRLSNFMMEKNAARVERNRFEANDHLTNADSLPVFVKHYLANILKNDKAVKSAYLLEKIPRYEPDDKIYVLVVKTKFRAKMNNETKEKIEQLNLAAGQVYLCQYKTMISAIRAKILAVANSRII